MLLGFKDVSYCGENQKLHLHWAGTRGLLETVEVSQRILSFDGVSVMALTLREVAGETAKLGSVDRLPVLEP